MAVLSGACSVDASLEARLLLDIRSEAPGAGAAHGTIERIEVYALDPLTPQAQVPKVISSRKLTGDEDPVTGSVAIDLTAWATPRSQEVASIQVAGLFKGQVVARFAGNVALDLPAVRPILMKRVEKGCDADADGFVDCSQEGCCPEDSPLFNDCLGDLSSGKPGEAEICDGLDNDCDGAVDESVTNDCGTCGALPTEICDTIDNDCDEKTDEGFDWKGFPVGEGCTGTGTCGTGTVVCTAAQDAATCSSMVAQHDDFGGQEEACNDQDDDCDDKTDEGFQWSGLSLGTDCQGAGPCGLGQVVCTENEAAAICDSMVSGHANYAATDELCNGEDDDCDGTTDEDFAYQETSLGEQCVHMPCGTGTVVCGADEASAICDVMSTQVDTDGDGLSDCADPDDDNDGTVDEDDCQELVATVYPGAPEACNEEDDDCDGKTDEGFQVPVEGGAAVLLGESCDGPDDDDCTDGLVVCAEDGESAICDDADTALEHVETCNTVDDDCDGTTDEGYQYSVPGAPGIGLEFGDPCDGPDDDECTDGTVVCAADGQSSICDDEITSPEHVETCDGFDEDCDGQTDEDFLLDGLIPGAPCDGPDGDKCSNGIVGCDPWDTTASKCVDGGQALAVIASNFGGLYVIDVTDPGNPIIQSDVAAEDFSAISIVGVEVQDHYAYLVDGAPGYGGVGLAVFDIDDPKDPQLMSTYIAFPESEFYHALDVVGTIAYVGVGSCEAYGDCPSGVATSDAGGLLIFDVSDPETPTVIGEMLYEMKFGMWWTSIRNIQVEGDIAYVGDHTNGLVLIDVADPTDPVFIKAFDPWNPTSCAQAYPEVPAGTCAAWGDQAHEVYVEGDMAYVGAMKTGLVILDVSNTSNPQLVGFVGVDDDDFSDGKHGWAHAVRVLDGFAYVAAFYEGLVVVDIHNPGKPVVVGSYPLDDASRIELVGKTLIVSGTLSNGLHIFDIASPGKPEWRSAVVGNQDGTFFPLDFSISTISAPGEVEVCNGVDDDCDVTIDEGIGVGAPCDGDDNDLCPDDLTACGPGETLICQDAGTGDDELERCNDADDDCDSLVDEGFDLGQACDGVDGDQCPDGEIVCDPSDPSTSVCQESTGPGISDVCDGADNDCDGAIDEDYPTAGDACDQSGPYGCLTGILACSATEDGVQCVKPDPPVLEGLSGGYQPADGFGAIDFDDFGLVFVGTDLGLEIFESTWQGADRLGFLPTAGAVRDVVYMDVGDESCWYCVAMAVAGQGLVIVDVEFPESPFVVKTVSSGLADAAFVDFFNDVALGRQVVTVSLVGVLAVVDISPVTTASVTGTKALDADVQDLRVVEDLVLVASTQAGLMRVQLDATTPSSSKVVWSSGIPTYAVHGYFPDIVAAMEDPGGWSLVNYDMSGAKDAPPATTLAGLGGQPSDMAAAGYFLTVTTNAQSGTLEVFEIEPGGSGFVVVDSATQETPGDARAVTFDPAYNLAFVADGDRGLQVFEVDPFGGVTWEDLTIGYLDYWDPTEAPLWAIDTSGTAAFLAQDLLGLRIVDISSAAAPVETARLGLGGTSREVLAVGNHVFVATDGVGLDVVDVKDQDAPQVVQSIPSSSGFQDLHFESPYLFMVTSGGSVLVHLAGEVEAGNLGSLQFKASYSCNYQGTGGSIGSAQASALVGVDLYVACGEGGVHRVLASSLSGQLQSIGWYDVEYAHDVEVAGGYAYVAAGKDGLLILPLENGALPTAQDAVQDPWLTDKDAATQPEDVRQVAISGDVLYLVDREQGIRIVDISDPGKPVPVSLQNGAIPGALPTGAWSTDKGAFGHIHHCVSPRGEGALIGDSAATMTILKLACPN